MGDNGVLLQGTSAVSVAWLRGGGGSGVECGFINEKRLEWSSKAARVKEKLEEVKGCERRKEPYVELCIFVFLPSFRKQLNCALLI